VEARFQLRFENQSRRHLGNSIRDRRYAQRSRPSTLLRYVHAPDGLREVTAGRHPVPELVEIVREFLVELIQRLTVDTGCTSVFPHQLVGLPKRPLRNLVWFCRSRRVPPVSGCLPERHK